MLKLSGKLSILLVIIASLIGVTACQPANGLSSQSTAMTAATTAPSETAPSPLAAALAYNANMALIKENLSHFENQTGILVNIELIAENDLRQRLTTQASTGSGIYDIVSVGNFETPFWAANGWLTPLDPLFNALTPERQTWYDRADLIASTAATLQDRQGRQYALPIYSETSLLYYNKDILTAHGQRLSRQPTWEDVLHVAAACHDDETIGLAIRVQPGWGMNGAVFGSMIHSFGAYWFDTAWRSGFQAPEMRQALEMYQRLVTDGGMADLEDPKSYGYNECLQLMLDGKAAMLYDASSLAGNLEDAQSEVRGRIGYCSAPSAVKPATWLWVWALGIDANSTRKWDAFQFITWATSKDLTALVATVQGWSRVPAGVRSSTYHNPEYTRYAPFARIVLNGIQDQNNADPAVIPVPYTGGQFCGIPEFIDFGDKTMALLADYATGKIELEECIAECDAICNQAAIDGGYQK